MDAFTLQTPPPNRDVSAYQRFSILISRGDQLREKFGGDALALLAASLINAKRPEGGARSFPGTAFILRQLKHPEEVYRLRSIYEDGLHILGLYCPATERKEELQRHYAMSANQADELMKRDEYERPDSGQRFRDAFHLADTFLAVGAHAELEETNQQLRHFLDLLFGVRLITPTKDEYAMSLAQAAALRSGSLARQVGAAIVNATGDVLALGTNEVPQFGGGSYWESDLFLEPASPHSDFRDHVRGYDSNDLMQRELIAEILKEIDPNWDEYDDEKRSDSLTRICSNLKKAGARIMNLTEFGRAVHAEMAALMAAARGNSSVKDGTLYVTTFPCHGCTKHIIDAGTRRVVYIEPYAKSLAQDLHSDAISVEDHAEPNKVRLAPFVGISPRRYESLFSMRTRAGNEVRRKDGMGKAKAGSVDLRLSMQPLTYVEREELAAKLLHKKVSEAGQ